MKYILNILFTLIGFVSFSQEVTSYKLSECDVNSYVDLVRRRIVSKSIENDTLLLRLGFIENCCLDPKPIIKKKNDTIFISMENVSETICMCDCCFEIDIKISDIKDTNFVLMWGAFEIKSQSKYPPLPHEFIIDNNTPLNKLNSDGIKIGLWHEQKESENSYEIYYDLNPSDKAIVMWAKINNEKGELINIAISQGRNGDMIYIEPNEYTRVFEK